MNQGKITESKKRKKLMLDKEAGTIGTFLTGTGLYEKENLNFVERSSERSKFAINLDLNEEMPEGPSPTEMLKDLMKS